MLNKRGYSFGAEYKFHYEQRIDGWAVFNAETDVDERTGLSEHEAFKLAMKLNGSPKPCIDDIDSTP